MAIERKYRFTFTDGFICTMYVKLKNSRATTTTIQEVSENSLKLVERLEKCGYTVRKKLTNTDLYSFLYTYKKYVDFDQTSTLSLDAYSVKNFTKVFDLTHLPSEILRDIGFTSKPITF